MSLRVVRATYQADERWMNHGVIRIVPDVAGTSRPRSGRSDFHPENSWFTGNEVDCSFLKMVSTVDPSDGQPNVEEFRKTQPERQRSSK